MILLFLYFTSLLTRLIFLFYGMPSITHDEADFFLNSYYLIKTGTDVFNNRLFLTSGHLAITGSIPVYIGSIFFLFFEKNIYLSRLPYAIISSFIPLFFYLLIKKLFKNNNNLALLNFFVLNFSPWFLHLSSQAAIEQITSLFFLISGFYFYLSNKKIIILNNEPKETFLLYSFYKINNASLIKEKWQNKDYSFDNVYFTNNCPKKPSSNNLYLMKRETCKKEKYNLIPYLYANDKSGVIYYKIKNVL